MWSYCCGYVRHCLEWNTGNAYVGVEQNAEIHLRCSSASNQRVSRWGCAGMLQCPVDASNIGVSSSDIVYDTRCDMVAKRKSLLGGGSYGRWCVLRDSVELVPVFTKGDIRIFPMRISWNTNKVLNMLTVAHGSGHYIDMLVATINALQYG